MKEDMLKLFEELKIQRVLVLLTKRKVKSRFHCGCITGKNKEFSFIYIKLNNDNGISQVETAC